MGGREFRLICQKGVLNASMNRKAKIGCGLVILLIVGAVLGAILSYIVTASQGFSTGLITCLGTLAGALLTSLPLIWIADSHRRAVPIFCLILVSLALVSIPFAWRSSSQKVTKIDERYSQFCSAVLHRSYKTAYTFMSPEYRATHTLDDFRQDEGIWDRPQSVYRGMEMQGCEPHPKHHVSISGNGKGAILYPGPYKHYRLFFAWRSIHGSIPGALPWAQREQ